MYWMQTFYWATVYALFGYLIRTVCESSRRKRKVRRPHG